MLLTDGIEVVKKKDTFKELKKITSVHKCFVFCSFSDR